MQVLRQEAPLPDLHLPRVRQQNFSPQLSGMTTETVKTPLVDIIASGGCFFD